MPVRERVVVCEQGLRGRAEEDAGQSGPPGQTRRRFRPVSLAALALLFSLAGCEAPGPPAVCGTLPQQTIVVGESATVTACFDEPGGNTLAYKVWTSDAGVVAVRSSGATVTVTAVSPGDALVTILADNGGLKAQQSMSVIVPNRPPLAIGRIEDREVIVGDSVTVDISAFFSEPDGQKLVYTAAADSSMLSATVAETMLTVVAIAKGTASVTLTATDPGGLNTVQSFLVTVPNRPPLAEGSVPGHTIEVADSAMVDITPFFVDPDGDALSYAAVASDTLVAAAAVVESMIKVTALAKGDAVVNVTATDTEGLTARQSFAVKVPKPPLVMESIPAQVVDVGQTEDLEMAPLFSDPDGDSLTYTAVSADRSVAWASVVGNAVSVLAIAKGETTISVTATDTEGLAVAQDFVVTVPNQPPLAEGSIPAQTVAAGSVFTVDATAHFSDPDGDSLTYAATTSDPTVATATTDGSTITVTALSGGEASVTVTATDTEGAVATLVFPVTVPNRPPLATADIAAQSLDEGDTETIDLGRYFSDPDTDDLTFEAASSRRRVATATVSGDALTVTAVSEGTANVTVTASDPHGASASIRFRVVVARPDTGNNPPAPAAPIPDQRMPVDGSASRDLRKHFDDPDGDNLTFEAATSDEAVATADVSGSDLTITAVAAGTASISVEAEDPGGLSTEISFDVTVGGTQTDNRAPLVTSQPPDRAIVKGKQLPVQGWHYFEDPDGDELTYSGSSSNPAVAGISQTNEYVFRVVGRSDGSATITITARDPEGLTNSASFTVKIGSAGNRAPTVKNEVGSLTSSPGQVDIFPMNTHFRDDDVGDELRLSVSSTNTAIVSVSVQNDTYYGFYAEVRGVAVGSATVTLTATDLGGLSASVSFPVTVDSNRPPRATGSFDDILETSVGDTLTYRLSNYFSDPDGDDLTYSATVGAAATVAVSGDTLLHIIGKVADGASFGRVTATDPGGKSADLSFTVYVKPASSSQDAGDGAQYASAARVGIRTRGARSWWP